MPKKTYTMNVAVCDLHSTGCTEAEQCSSALIYEAKINVEIMLEAVVAETCLHALCTVLTNLGLIHCLH